MWLRVVEIITEKYITESMTKTAMTKHTGELFMAESATERYNETSFTHFQSAY